MCYVVRKTLIGKRMLKWQFSNAVINRHGNRAWFSKKNLWLRVSESSNVFVWSTEVVELYSLSAYLCVPIKFTCCWQRGGDDWVQSWKTMPKLCPKCVSTVPKLCPKRALTVPKLCIIVCSCTPVGYAGPEVIFTSSKNSHKYDELNQFPPIFFTQNFHLPVG